MGRGSLGGVRPAHLIAAILVATSLVGACRPKPAWEECVANHPLACTVVDGVALGVFDASQRPDAQPCTEPCADLLGTAVAAVEDRFPDHPPIRSIEMFGPDWRAICQGRLCTVSGRLQIFVFTFEDGELTSIVVRCPGVSPTCQVAGISSLGHP